MIDSLNDQVAVLLSRPHQRIYVELTPPLKASIMAVVWRKCPSLAWARTIETEYVFNFRWPLSRNQTNDLFDALRQALPDYAVELRVRPSSFQANRTTIR